MENQGKSIKNTVPCIQMNLHSLSPKKDCTNEYSIQKLSENIPFHDSNITHLGRKIIKYILVEWKI